MSEQTQMETRTVEVDEIVEEIVRAAEKDGTRPLPPLAREALREIVDRTVGAYVRRLRTSSLAIDFWGDRQFRHFALSNCRRIGDRARQLGGPSPSEADVRQAADEVIEAAHNSYCETLPDPPQEDGPTESSRAASVFSPLLGIGGTAVAEAPAWVVTGGPVCQH